MGEKKNKIYLFVSLIIGLVLLIFFYSHVGIQKIFVNFSLLNLWQIILIIALSFLALFFAVKRFQLAIKDFGKFRPSLKKTAEFWLMGYAITYLTPTGHFGGEPVKAYALSKSYNYSFSKSLLTTIIEQSAYFLSLAVFSLIGAILFFLKRDLNVGFFLLSWFLFIVLIIFLTMKLWRNEKFFDYIFKLFFLHKIKVEKKNGQTALSLSDEIKKYGNQAINYIRNFPPCFILSFFYSLGFCLIWLVQAKLFFFFLGLNVSFANLFFLKVMIDIFKLAPLPASLGAFEAAHLLSFSFFGLSQEGAIAFSLFGRAMDSFFAGVGLWFGTKATAKSAFELLKI